MPNERAPRTRNPGIRKSKLDARVDEAIVDAYGDDEQRLGFFTKMEDYLKMPLPAPPPEGAEWIEAYRHWARGGQGHE